MQEAGAKPAAGAGGARAATAPRGEEEAPGSTPRRHKRPPVWQQIWSNLYTHRERKEQDEDDIMICQVGAELSVSGGACESVRVPGMLVALLAVLVMRAMLWNCAEPASVYCSLMSVCS